MILNKIYCAVRNFCISLSEAGKDDRGIGVVEVILILVVLIGLVVIFRDQLTGIVNTIFGRIAEDANGI